MIAKMFKNYKERTEAHIKNVGVVFDFLYDNENTKNYLEDMFIYKNELVKRIEDHDQSKFSIEEMMGYILMTEKYGRKVGYKFSSEDQDIMDKAWSHHKEVNKHHPEHFDSIDKMMFADIIEMVCDWGAMSLEFGDSLVKYKDEKAYSRFVFTDDQKVVIDFLCLEIERGLLT